MSTWNMGHAASLVTVLGADVGLARPRPAGPLRDVADPIRLVDAAVQSALAELRSAQRPGEEPGTSVCLDRLFAQRHAEALPPGTRWLRVGPGTVVTPLARDLLRRRGITIHLGLPASARCTIAGEWGFSISAGFEWGQIEVLRRALVEDPRSWVELSGELAAMAGWLLEKPVRGVLLLTPEPEFTVWQLCQVLGFRAAAAREPADVHRAVRTLGINVLVVDPAGKSISWIRQLGQAFRHAGAPAAPHGLGREEQSCESPR